MFEKIVIAYDGSPHAEKALVTGLDIASKYRAKVHIVEVVDTSLLAGMGLTPIPQSVIDQLFTKARKDVESARERAAKMGVDAEGNVLEGDPATVILDFINKVDAKLIVTGTRGLSTWKKIFIGSVSSRIVRESKIPVLIVK
jgi:nucleotide-binding universal stress UspA family protein